MWKKLTPLAFASLLGVGTFLVLPSPASAAAIPAAQRDALNEAIGDRSDGLYQQAHQRRWHRNRYRDRWRHGRRWRGDYGYYPRRRHWRRHYYYDDWDYPYGYYGGWRGPGIYFSF